MLGDCPCIRRPASGMHVLKGSTHGTRKGAGPCTEYQDPRAAVMSPKLITAHVGAMQINECQGGPCGRHAGQPRESTNSSKGGSSQHRQQKQQWKDLHNITQKMMKRSHGGCCSSQNLQNLLLVLFTAACTTPTKCVAVSPCWHSNCCMLCAVIHLVLLCYLSDSSNVRC